MEKGKVLLTGITGNVGTYIYKHLIELQQPVLGAVTSIAKSKERFSNAELVEFDFMDAKTYDCALEGVDRVFLMRPPHIGNPEDLYPFINAMKAKGVKLVVFLSLMGIEKNPVPPHYKIEKYIEKAGLSYCHIRPGFFMQNLSGIHAQEIKGKGEIFIPAGKSKCSFIDAEDIGLAVATILSQPEKNMNTAYTITGGEALDYDQVAEVLSDVLGKKVIYTKPSWLRFRNYMIKVRGQEKKMVIVMIMLYFMTRIGTAQAIYPDFERLTGKKPRTIREFAESNKQSWLNK